MADGSYDKQRRYNRKKSAEGAEIGEIPEVVNLERKESCRLDLLKFLVTYFPASTGLKPFSPAHIDAISRIQRCVLEGGLFVNVFPRGFAKTTISENATIWAGLYGHRRFIPIFGSDASAAGSNIESIKTELAENDLLFEDFPEVCHAIRALEGKPQRCGSQTCEGELTHIEWRADTIVLPTIAGSAASGAILTASGIEGASRGMKHKRPDGTQQRPDFVLLDDPQTDGSARSLVQTQSRLDVIRKSILKLGGHNRKIAVVMNATVIRPDDLVETLLDPKKFPAWQGVRIKMVGKWADGHEKLWLGDYARIRNTFDPLILGDQQRAHRAATEFYKTNRAAMDKGCEVAWEHCYDPETELSAIQHAYNALIDDGEEVFASECQNEPLVPKIEGQQETITADEVAGKVNRLARGVLPAEASRVVGFIDVHDNVLFWMVCGFGDGFTGAIVDYGTWPEQNAPYFAQRNVKNTIARKTGKKQFEEQLYAALDILVGTLAGKEWKREDGTLLKLERMPVDARDGDHAETVKAFCRRSPHAAVLIPSNGIYVGAKRQGLNERPPVTGERRGWNWRIEPKAGSRGILRFDTNAWKTRMHSFLTVQAGGKGFISIFGDKPEQHKLVADHLTAEYPVRVSAYGRTVSEWQARPNRDNHWGDCFIGCGVAAGTLGVEVAGQQQAAKRLRVKLSEVQKKAKHWKAAG